MQYQQQHQQVIDLKCQSRGWAEAHVATETKESDRDSRNPEQKEKEMARDVDPKVELKWKVKFRKMLRKYKRAFAFTLAQLGR